MKIRSTPLTPVKPEYIASLSIHNSYFIISPPAPLPAYGIVSRGASPKTIGSRFSP